VGVVLPAGEVANHAVMYRLTLPVNLFINHVRQLPTYTATILLRHLSECLHQVRLKY
jgi:hypothetical protein